MKWRSMEEITKDELYPVIDDMFNIEWLKIVSQDDDEIEVTICTKWGETECVDDLLLKNTFDDSVDAQNLLVSGASLHKWQQWLMAKGYHSAYKLLLDNKYFNK